MPANAGAAPETRPRASQIDWVATGILIVLAALYFVQAVMLAANAPLWMDEVLTVWTARQPDAVAVWRALAGGAEFTPPLYDWTIHTLQSAGIASPLGLRLPSLLAVYLVAVAAAVLTARHTRLAVAAMAAGMVLAGGLFAYAIQVRPYALVTAAFAWAVVLYDRPGKPSIARLTGIALLLGIAIGLHFYALLLAGVLALIELVRAREANRAPCWRTLAAIAVAACSILLWFPLLMAARTYSGADVAAPGYYGRPTLLTLIGTYDLLLGWLLVPLAGLLMAAARLTGRASHLLGLALVIAAVPLVVFVFALLVSHSYADRYCLAGSLGIALLFAALSQRLGTLAGPVSVMLLAFFVLAVPWRQSGEVGNADRRAALEAVARSSGSLPIATGDGMRFFEIRENAPSGSRLVYLDTPGVPSRDPTNRNQVMRWKALDPSLKVVNARSFVCATPVFLLFAQPGRGGVDNLPKWLAGRADFAPPPHGRASLTLVRSRPCADA